jgi:hypothetical protein
MRLQEGGDETSDFLVVPVDGYGRNAVFVDDIRDVDRLAVDAEKGQGLPRGTTERLCALTKKGWINLLIEPREDRWGPVLASEVPLKSMEGEMVGTVSESEAERASTGKKREEEGLGYCGSVLSESVIRCEVKNRSRCFAVSVDALESGTSEIRPAGASSSDWVKHCLERLDHLEDAQVNLSTAVNWAYYR